MDAKVARAAGDDLDSSTRVRRLATTLSALGFLWGCAATGYLFVVSSPAGISRAATIAASAGDGAGMPPPLATAEGVWVAGLLIGVALLAGVPLGVARRHPAGHRWTAAIVGFTILGFCALAGSVVGLLHLPGALLLLASSAVGKAGPYADLRT